MFVLNHKKSKENFGFDTKSSGTIFTEIVLYVCFDKFAVHLYSAYVKVDPFLKLKNTQYNPEYNSAKKYRIFAIFVFECFRPKIFLYAISTYPFCLHLISKKLFWDHVRILRNKFLIFQFCDMILNRNRQTCL